MPSTDAPTLDARYVEDDATLNRINRLIARIRLRYFAASATLVTAWAVLLMMATAFSWIEAFADGTDEPTAAILAGLSLFFVYLLWIEFSQLGRTIATALRPDSTIVGGQVDGVTIGDMTAELTKDAVGWRLRDYTHHIHLAAFHRDWSKGGFLLLGNNPAETHYMVPDNLPRWRAEVRRRRKDAPKAGWKVPPEDDGWQHYHLPREAFEAGLTDKAKEALPKGSILAVSFALIGVVITAWFVGSKALPLSGVTAPQWLLIAPMLLALPKLAIDQVQALIVGIKRRRKGLTTFGRDFEGVTHGAGAWRLVPGGIEVHRAYLRQTIRWDGVAAVEKADGWLALRAGEITLAMVPAAREILDEIPNVGLRAPDGPWAVKDGKTTWKRAA